MNMAGPSQTRNSDMKGISYEGPGVSQCTDYDATWWLLSLTKISTTLTPTATPVAYRNIHRV